MAVGNAFDDFHIMSTFLQLKMKGGSEKTNARVIHEIMYPLGRRHVSFGSNPVSMEVLGTLIHKSLMQAIPKDQIGEEKYEGIERAFFELFKSMVYWLQFGFNSESRNAI